MADSATRQWCTERGHPFITYNPWLDRSYCRCGHRQEPGDRSQDWNAKYELFHDHKPGTLCRCYVSTAKGAPR